MIYAKAERSEKIGTKEELQRHIDHMFSHSKNYLSMVKTDNNGIIYPDGNKLIEEINLNPSKQHKDFMKVFSEQDTPTAEYVMVKISLYFSVEINNILYSNVFRKTNETDIKIGIADELAGQIIVDTGSSLEEWSEQISNAYDVQSFQELITVDRWHLNWLFLEKGMTDNTVLSTSHIDENGNINIYSIIKEQGKV